MRVSHVLRDRNTVLNRKHLFSTTSQNVNKHPSMWLHIFTEAITNTPYYQPREVSSAHSLICYAPYWKEYARPAALFLINFWHHFSMSALGMQGVKFIVAGLIFHLAKNDFATKTSPLVEYLGLAPPPPQEYRLLLPFMATPCPNSF